MAPCQSLMDVNSENQSHHTRKVTPESEKSSLNNADGYHVKCMTSCEDVNRTVFPLDEQSNALKGAEDIEVNISDCLNESDCKLTEAEDPDSTECSSSFVNISSDTEKHCGFSDAEVESQFFGDDDLGPGCDAFSRMAQTRKKNLTTHWRNFIRPLMWRCKWTELRIKEIEHQALKYSNELAAYDQRKLSGIDPSTIEGFGSKSLPYSNQYYREKAIKRRKRKRVEDTTDIASYMSDHNLFSYLETKKANSDGTALADDFGSTAVEDQNVDSKKKLDVNNNQQTLKFQDDDKPLEQLLWKIEMMHSRVNKLKGQLDVVMSKNAAKFSSSENLSLLVPCDGQTPSPTFSPGNGEAISAGVMYNPVLHILEYDVSDLVMPESVISSYGGDFHVPDIIESTVGILSGSDVTFRQSQIGDSCEDTVDNVLIHNEAAEAERHTFLMTGNRTRDVHHEAEMVEEVTGPSQILKSESGPMVKPTGPQEQPTLESCLAADIHIPRNKRKRGERKACSGGWSKQQPGDPDSQ